jgi:hypothetical protein
MSIAAARLTIPALCAVLAVSLLLAAGAVSRSAEKAGAEPKLAHTVFFTLKDHSPEAREKFVASCRKYLTGHVGAEFFAVGAIAEDVNEGAVSVRDFDISLHVVFSSKADEATYLKHPRHLEFVAENKASFEKVRVFDSYLSTP